MKVAIIGTGAYGLSLALMANLNNNDITMWTKFEEEKELLELNHGNPKLLPNTKLPDNIKITTNMEECVKGSDVILIVVPAGFVDDVSKQLKKYYTNQHICIGSKGIEQDTCRFVYDVFKQNINTDKISIISGPSFAIDIASYVPIGLTIASTNKQTIKIVKKALQNQHLRLRETNDIIGTEICGSIKNIIAIASGIIDGMDLPESTQAMLITEAVHDIKELIHSLNGNKKTIISYAGIGDLILTCTSPKSRNFTFGQMIGAKKPKEEIDNYIKNTTIEGLYTLKSIHQLLKNKKVNIPIIDIMYQIIIYNEDASLLTKYLIEKK